MSDEKEPMDMMEIMQLREAGKMADLYADVVASLPRCRCGRLSGFVRSAAGGGAHYACGFAACRVQDESDDWDDAAWKWHVVAHEMTSAAKRGRG